MLKELYRQSDDNALVVESYKRQLSNDLKPLFFYHGYRVGGLSFFSPLINSFFALNDNIKKKNPNIQNLPHAARIDETGPELLQLRQAPYLLVSGHVDFGFHKIFSQSFDLVTVIRDPVARVTSEYTKLCMRQAISPNTENFQKHYRNPQNQNVLVKQLHPEAFVLDPQTIQPGGLYVPQNKNLVDCRAVIDNLQENFEAYALNTHILELQSYYVTKYQLPNLIRPNINQTLDDFKIETSSHEDEILSLNSADEDLYQFVKSQPKVPRWTFNQNPSLVDLTVRLTETEKQTHTQVHCDIVSTAQLLQQLQTASPYE